MSYRVLVLILAAVLSVMVTGCRDRQPKVKADPVAVSVNGESITEAEVGSKIQQLVGHGQGITAEIRQQAEKELIEQELLSQRAVELGLDRDEKFRQAVRAMEVRLRDFKRAELARRVKNTQVAALVEVAAEDVKKYYAQNEALITTDLHLLVLRFTDESAARQARQRMTEGASFETVLASTDPEAAQKKLVSQDLGFLEWNQVPAEWAEAAASLKTGETSQVLTSRRTGPCIIKVLDRRKNNDEPFERMSASIMNRLRDIRLSEAYDRYIAGLRKEAKIVKQ